MNVNVWRKPLGDILLENGLITAAQLEEALNVQQETGERLGKVLVNLGYVTEMDILEVLEYQLGIPQVSLASIPLNAGLIESLPESLIRRHRVIPLTKEGNRLVVAVSDPLNVVAIDDLRLATGYEIQPVLAAEREIDAVIQKYFGFPDLEEGEGRLQIPEVPDFDALDLDVQDGAPVDEAPVVRLANSIIIQGISQGASDIHVEPLQDQIRVRYRVDGLLREVMTIPRRFRASLVSRIKIIARLDIAERRVPQDGRIRIKYQDQEIDLRVSIMPTVYGEKVVLRILNPRRLMLRVEYLGFESENLKRFQKLIARRDGMILITGPTGSGKTTTLYAALAEINAPELNLITIEDPVEYLLPGINQIQINPKTGLTFARGLRSVLRQDPDVIMVGEIRDSETAEIAVRAATTGHLVFSTLHTNNAAGALTRLIEMGIEPFLVASSVIGVVAQRLVRLLCPRCRERYEVPPGAPERYLMGVGENDNLELWRGKGCSNCGKTGYRGRTTVGEVMVVTPSIRKLINEKATAEEIHRVAVAEGMIPFREDGFRKVRAGITSIQEIIRVASSDF